MALTINISFILETISLGIVASLIVAIVVELWKKRLKPFHISVTLDSCEVYSSRDKQDVRIRVDYKDKAIENTLAIMYVSIVNDGQNDIMFRSHFLDAISVKCEGFDILSIAAEDSRVAPKCLLSDEGTARLSWDIFKRREKMRLCIAAHSKVPITKGMDGVECFNKLSFDFRSDCIDTMEPIKELTQQEAQQKEHHRYLLNLSILNIVACLFVFLSEATISSRYDYYYDGQSYQNAILLYSPLARRYILSSDKTKTQLLSISDLKKIDSIVPSETKNAADRISLQTRIVFCADVSLYLDLLGAGNLRFGKRRFPSDGCRADCPGSGFHRVCPCLGIRSAEKGSEAENHRLL